MIHHSSKDLDEMERIYRANLVNSVTGYKSASLLATRSNTGIDNVAIYSSVTHLGSNPAMFSFIQRPLSHDVGHTYENLKETGHITLNHINLELLDRAHQSSAKYAKSTSEFQELGIETLNREGIDAPFVKNAAIQVAARYEGEYYLKENKCTLVLCRITDIFLNDGILQEDGWLNLEKAGSLTINGLDGYATGTVQKRLSYAQLDTTLKEIDL
jgi:flavin reductase (DIM6/NTAB) family NADH-FMN oxidoreductase RutF